MEVETNRETLSSLLPRRARGSYQKNFRESTVISNFYKVQMIREFDILYIFSIKFEPNIPKDNRQKRKDILTSIWSQITNFVENPAICGMNLISNCQPRGQIRQFNAQAIKVTIKKVKVLDVKQNPNLLLFFLNNSLRNVMSEISYNQIGRTGKFFNIKYKTQIDNLNMYSGFKVSFCKLEKGIFLRVDSAKKIVRNQTVLQFINQIYSKNNDKDKQDKRNLVKNALKDQIIQVNYGNGRYYKVEDILYLEMTEYFVAGQKLNLVDYYKQKYNITITKPKQPLLKAQNKKGNIQIVLVPELCLMTGIPDDFDEMRRKKISQSTILDAYTKKKQIHKFMDQIKKTEDFNNLAKIGIQLDRKMHQLSAKTIPTPKLALGDNNRVQEGKQAFFNLFNQPIYASKHRIKLAVLFFRADLRDTIRTFQNTSRNLKVEFQYEQYQIRDQRKAVEEISYYLRKAVDKGCNVSLIVIPNHMKTQYKRIKQASLIDNKLVCQIMTQGKLRNKNAQSIATKVLLQIIAKRGNTLWVSQTKTKLQDTMLIGVDTANVQGNRAILAAVGTVNSTFTSVYSKHIQYEGLQNKFSAMVKAVLDIVQYYLQRNKIPPKDIVLFMNSCSGQQVKLLHEYFVTQFIKKAEEVYKQKCPSLQVVMINVKTSQRFFTPDGQNVRAGTLINSEIVSNDYDFYLVSQSSNRGCSVPNHYKVVFNNSKMQQGVLEQLAFGQCFNYVNWSGSIKLPGILQYAKKCAKFNAEFMNDKKVSQNLQKCLYFV